MKKELILLTISILFLSCSNSPDKETVNTDAAQVEALSSIKQDKKILKNGIRVEFDELTIILENIEMDWEGSHLSDDKLYKTDSIAYFNLHPGDWMYDKTLQIEETEYDQIELYVQIVNHVGIDSERSIEMPFCVLSNWKNYTSGWVKIPSKNGELMFDSQIEIVEKNIKYSLSEFKTAVSKSCGKEWLEEIRHIEVLEDLPTSDFTSQYNYKILVRNTKTGKTLERIIVFDTPTSC
jgi:hypothetical protein